MDGYITMDDQRIGLPFLKELAKTDIIYALKETYMPTLIMQGAKDDITPASQLDFARTYIPSKRIEITTFQDGGHGLEQLNHRKMMFYHTMQFMEKFC